MTQKVYKSAMGRPIDLGSLILQNENVRAVGNMNVNARGDLLDGSNKVIDRKNRQVQRQYQRTTNVSADVPVQTSTRAAKQAKAQEKAIADSQHLEDPLYALTTETINEPLPEPVVAPEPLPENTFGPTGEGGLAAAIARSRLIKQEKEKTLRERQQAQGIRKI
jgi:hypothetical protein